MEKIVWINPSIFVYYRDFFITKYTFEKDLDGLYKIFRNITLKEQFFFHVNNYFLNKPDEVVLYSSRDAAIFQEESVYQYFHDLNIDEDAVEEALDTINYSKDPVEVGNLRYRIISLVKILNKWVQKFPDKKSLIKILSQELVQEKLQKCINTIVTKGTLDV